jgi:hypothetical protein
MLKKSEPFDGVVRAGFERSLAGSGVMHRGGGQPVAKEMAPDLAYGRFPSAVEPGEVVIIRRDSYAGFQSVICQQAFVFKPKQIIAVGVPAPDQFVVGYRHLPIGYSLIH